MDRIDRRTFLTTGVKAGAALAAVGLVSDAVVQGVTVGASTATGGSSAAPGPPIGLSTTGVAGSAGPVGVDPDDVQFAWQVADGRRGAVQGAYRIVVSGPDGSASTVWDSSEVHIGAAGLRALRRTAAGRRHQLPVDGQDGGRPRRLEWAQRPGHLRHRAAPEGLDRSVGQTGARRPRSRGLYLCAHGSNPSRRDHHPGHGVRRRRPQVPAVGQRHPTRLRSELLLSRRAVLPGHRCHLGGEGGPVQRLRRPPPLVRPGAWPSHLGPGPPGPGHRALRRRAGW